MPCFGGQVDFQPQEGAEAEAWAISFEGLFEPSLKDGLFEFWTANKRHHFVRLLAGTVLGMWEQSPGLKSSSVHFSELERRLTPSASQGPSAVREISLDRAKPVVGSLDNVCRVCCLFAGPPSFVAYLPRFFRQMLSLSNLRAWPRSLAVLWDASGTQL